MHDARAASRHGKSAISARQFHSFDKIAEALKPEAVSAHQTHLTPAKLLSVFVTRPSAAGVARGGLMSAYGEIDCA